MRAVTLRGVTLYLHKEDALSDAIAKTGDFWEADILDYIRDNHNDQGTILDIGANIGNHTVYFANFLNYGAIMAFEPDDDNFGLLDWNTKPYNNMGLAHFAVSDHTGTVDMRKHPQNKGAHQVVDEGGEATPCISIDKIALTEVTLMKIDAEWHEPQILEGATDTIIRSHPLILIEDVELAYHRILMPLGYKISKYWPDHNTFLWRYEE